MNSVPQILLSHREEFTDLAEPFLTQGTVNMQCSLGLLIRWPGVKISDAPPKIKDLRSHVLCEFRKVPQKSAQHHHTVT